MNEPIQPGLFIGIDWADQKHDCYVIDRDGKGFHQELKQSPEDIDAWIGEMLKRADGKPIAIMLEQSRGPLVHALMFRDNVLLFPINPKQFARYRESYPGGGKDDPTDAKYLARMLRERIATLTAWTPDDEKTRLLAHLSRQEREQGHAWRFGLQAFPSGRLPCCDAISAANRIAKIESPTSFGDVLCVRYPSRYDFATADCRPSPQQCWRIGLEDRSSRVASTLRRVGEFPHT